MHEAADWQAGRFLINEGAASSAWGHPSCLSSLCRYGSGGFIITIIISRIYTGLSQQLLLWGRSSLLENCGLVLRENSEEIQRELGVESLLLHVGRSQLSVCRHSIVRRTVGRPGTQWIDYISYLTRGHQTGSWKILLGKQMPGLARLACYHPLANNQINEWWRNLKDT